MDDIPGNAGLGIDIPVNEFSRAIFGNPERFEKYGSGSDRKFPGFEIRQKGVLLERGTFVITGADQERYTGWLQSELGVLGEEQRDKFIDELPWKTQQTFVNKVTYSQITDEYAAPTIHNQAFWEGKGKQITEVRKYQDEEGVWQKMDETIEYLTARFRDNFSYLINQREGSSIKSTGEGCVVSPMLFLQYVLKEIFRMHQWYINRNDLYDNIAMRELFIYNNFNIVRPLFTKERVEFSEFDREFMRYITRELDRIVGVSWGVATFSYRDLIPHVPLKDFILGLQNYLNYVFFFRTDKKIDIIDRDAIPDSTPIDIDSYFVNEWIMGERSDSRLKFIAEVEKNDGIQGEDWHDLSDRLDDFGDPVDTYADLLAISDPDIGELRLVIEENKIYEWKWSIYIGEDEVRREHQEDVLRWEFVSTGPQPYQYGDADEIEEIRTEFSTLLKFFKAFGLDLLSIPYVRQHGNIDIMRSLWSDFSPRLVFNVSFSGAATDELGGYNLNWPGENGLFEKRWKRWSRLWKNRLPVEGYFDFPLSVIDYIKMNIHKKFRTRHGEFIIQEMETEFGIEKVGITKIKGFKV